MADRTDTEVAVDLLRAYAAGGKDRPGRPAICIAVEHIDRLEARYEAMRTVARMLFQGARIVGTIDGPVWAGECDDLSDAVALGPDARRALDELDADRG